MKVYLRFLCAAAMLLSSEVWAVYGVALRAGDGVCAVSS